MLMLLFHQGCRLYNARISLRVIQAGQVCENIMGISWLSMVRLGLYEKQAVVLTK